MRVARQETQLCESLQVIIYLGAENRLHALKRVVPGLYSDHVLQRDAVVEKGAVAPTMDCTQIMLYATGSPRTLPLGTASTTPPPLAVANIAEEDKNLGCTHGVAQLPRRPGVLLQRLDSKRCICRISVSYTHLTLPTKA